MRNWSPRVGLIACVLAWSGCISSPRDPAPERRSPERVPSDERFEPLLIPTVTPLVHWQPLRLLGAISEEDLLDTDLSSPDPAPAPLLAAPLANRPSLRFRLDPQLDASWLRSPPSANLYPRWEQLQDQRRLGDGRGFRLGEGSSLGALWTSEDGPAGIVAFRRDF